MTFEEFPVIYHSSINLCCSDELRHLSFPTVHAFYSLSPWQAVVQYSAAGLADWVAPAGVGSGHVGNPRPRDSHASLSSCSCEHNVLQGQLQSSLVRDIRVDWKRGDKWIMIIIAFAAGSGTTSPNTFPWMKMYEFQLKFHWSLFPRVQLTISQHWFR